MSGPRAKVSVVSHGWKVKIGPSTPPGADLAQALLDRARSRIAAAGILLTADEALDEMTQLMAEPLDAEPPAWHRLFLAGLAIGLTREQAAARAGVDEETMLADLIADVPFAKAAKSLEKLT